MARAFDLAAYGYTGPRREEPAADEQPTTLTINIGAALDEDFVEQLRAMVRKSTKPTAAAPAVEATTPVEPVAETTPVEAAPETPAAEPEPEAPAAADPWAALTAHLTQDEPDAWSVLVSNLTTTASSSAATEA